MLTQECGDLKDAQDHKWSATAEPFSGVPIALLPVGTVGHSQRAPPPPPRRNPWGAMQHQPAPPDAYWPPKAPFRACLHRGGQNLVGLSCMTSSQWFQLITGLSSRCLAEGNRISSPVDKFHFPGGKFFSCVCGCVLVCVCVVGGSGGLARLPISAPPPWRLLKRSPEPGQRNYGSTGSVFAQ